MSCTTCSSSGCGSSGGSCSGSCGKKDVFDWLGNMTDAANPFDVVEVKFKGGRKGFYRNVHNLELYTGDAVVVQLSSGQHIGYVSLQGELVRLQMRKYREEYNDDMEIIYRVAGEQDLEKFQEAKNRELPTLFRTREIIREMELNMKLSDVEFQADNNKATFFYSADQRVDFRALIKRLAGEFRVRVEMRQISLRQEAGRIGGVGSCGRELCCSTWLTDFKSVSTSAARYQNLALNPSKLSGQCGRLKCCLNYELDTYMEELKDIPTVRQPLKLEIGVAFHQKTDIFKKLMWFAFKDETHWVSISVDRVRTIMDMNAKGKKPYSLEMDHEEEVAKVEINDDLKKLDRKLRKKTEKKPERKSDKRRSPRQERNERPKERKPKEEKKSAAPQQEKPAAKGGFNKPKSTKFKPRANKAAQGAEAERSNETKSGPVKSQGNKGGKKPTFQRRKRKNRNDEKS